MGQSAPPAPPFHNPEIRWNAAYYPAHVVPPVPVGAEDQDTPRGQSDA